MATTYKFRINAVDVYTSKNDLEKVIYNVHWSYIAEDENGNTASLIGVKKLSEPSAETFVSFDTLIQDDIISWIEPLMEIEVMQANLDAKIAEKIAPTIQTLQVPLSLVEEAVEETTTEETV